MKALLHFEDFHEGQVFALGPHEMTKAAVIEFATEFDPQPFHLDEAAAAASLLGGLAASGWHTSAAILRMICDACLSQSAVLGSSGMDEVKWLKPVLVGDVLSGQFMITSLRLSASRAGVGIMKFTAAVANQKSEPTAEISGMFFMQMRQA